MKFIGLLSSLLLLVGCAGLPSEAEIANADYGSYPADYEQIVKAYFARVLKDPDSVKYQDISAPKKGWLGNRIDGAKFGYLTCATLNAKNSYGGYVGYSTDALLIRNGQVIEYVEKGNWFGHNLC